MEEALIQISELDDLAVTLKCIPKHFATITPKSVNIANVQKNLELPCMVSWKSSKTQGDGNVRLDLLCKAWVPIT